VRARVRPGLSWPEIFAATFPPASVSGAPNSRALRLIEAMEPSPRGPYCGAIGYVSNAADNIAGGTREAVLAVGIRTFWLDGDELAFGTGAGVTWGSRAEGEWDETELKARLLVGLASSATDADQDNSALTSRSRSMKSHSLPGGTSR
jgi:para-aminobenzoate synthetase component 1